MNSEDTRESTAVVTGLGLVCLALFSGVSLYTHSPCDVMDYHVLESAEMSNSAGLIGAQLAHYAFSMYGSGAWVITLLMLVFGSVLCATRSAQGLWSRMLGGILLTAVICAWFGAIDKPGTVAGVYPAGPGGLLGGTFLAPPLIGYFGKVGVFLVLTAASMLACLLLAQNLTESLLAFLGRSIVRASHWLIDLVLGRHSNMATGTTSTVQPAVALSGASGIHGAGVRIHRATITNALADATALPEENHFEALPAPETRKMRIPASDLPGKNGANRVSHAERNTDTEEVLEVQVPESLARRMDLNEDKLSGKKTSNADAKAEAKILSEAEESERRRQEAMRQAEVAEADRLERERVSKEQYAVEAKKLEKLEKEMAAKDKERQKQQEKFAATIAEAAAANADAMEQSGDDTDEVVEQAEKKPSLPVNYELPKYDVLIPNDITPNVTSESLKERGATVIQTLWDFKIGAKLVGIQSGPTVTMYELELDPGIKVQRVVGLQDNLAMAMKAEHGVRIIAPIPGKATIGLEMPNTEDHTVRMRPILESPQFRSKNWTLPLILGRDAVGNPLVADLATMPHLLIAGTTGSGKSVCVNSIILSLMILRRPHEVKLILVDPKQVEMTDFKGIPHLLTPVVTDMKMAAGVLTWAVQKMEERYERMSHVGVRNIGTYNKMTSEERFARLPEEVEPNEYADPMPYIVIIVDEFADLMMTAGKEIEQAIARLAQKARAAGLHVILATQRPSADVLTGLIKTNLPCRICFQVKSKIDSRIVLDQGGADKLAGKGDMLFVGAGNSNLIRAKGVFIADDEIRGIVSFCKNQAEPIYTDEIEKVAMGASGEGDDDQPDTNRQAIEMDDKFDEAVESFLVVGRASTSLLQRRMGLGYTRAAKLCDQMESRGIIGPDRGAKGRELLITQDAWDTFKRARAGALGATYGPKGSKDNPIKASASSASEQAIEADEGIIKSVAEVDPELLARLTPVDGVKHEDEIDEM